MEQDGPKMNRLVWATPGFDDWPLEKWHSVLQALYDSEFFGIEPLISEPYQLSQNIIKDLLEQYHLTIIGFRTGGIALKHNVSFNHPVRSARDEAHARFKEVIHYASCFGTPRILTGLIQGKLQPDQHVEHAEDNIQQILVPCAEDAERYHLEIDIEPVNRYELGYHATISSVKKFISCIGLKNIQMLVDTFHMNIEEPDIEESISYAQELISHVHLSDSNRSVPGNGHFSFKEFIRVLESIKYEGFLSVEADTDSNPEEINACAEYLKKCLWRKNADYSKREH